MNVTILTQGLAKDTQGNWRVFCFAAMPGEKLHRVFVHKMPLPSRMAAAALSQKVAAAGAVDLEKWELAKSTEHKADEGRVPVLQLVGEADEQTAA